MHVLFLLPPFFCGVGKVFLWCFFLGFFCLRRYVDKKGVC